MAINEHFHEAFHFANFSRRDETKGSVSPTFEESRTNHVDCHVVPPRNDKRELKTKRPNGTSIGPLIFLFTFPTALLRNLDRTGLSYNHHPDLTRVGERLFNLLNDVSCQCRRRNVIHVLGVD